MASAMTRAELTEKLLGIKRENDWTWKHICAEIGGMSPVLVTGAILGQMKLTKGQIFLNTRDVSSFRAHERARAGIGFVPQGRHVFPHLTVDENLSVGLSALGVVFGGYWKGRLLAPPPG